MVLVVSGDAFGEEELFSGDAGGAVLPFECDPVGAFLGPRALPGGHHQPAIARCCTAGFWDHQLPGGCGQRGKEQGTTGFGRVHVSRRGRRDDSALRYFSEIQV